MFPMEHPTGIPDIFQDIPENIRKCLTENLFQSLGPGNAVSFYTDDYKLNNRVG